MARFNELAQWRRAQRASSSRDDTMRHRAHSRSRSPPRRDDLQIDSSDDKDKHGGYIEISCKSCNNRTCRSVRQFVCRAIGSFIVCMVLFIGYLAFDEYKIILKQRAARLKYFATHPRPKSYKPVNCQPDSNASITERYYNGLAFVHVPKCGGTSIREMIYGVAVSCRFINFVHEGREKWKQLSETRRINTKVYGGLNHLSYYELDQTWPGTHMDTAAFFTQLRNPWERLNSHFHYAKSMGGLHKLGEETENTPFNEWSKTMKDGYLLSFFAEHNFTEVGGHELRRCCFDERDLENAKALLRKRFIVSLVEEPQKTIDLLRCRVSWVHKAMRPILVLESPYTQTRGTHTISVMPEMRPFDNNFHWTFNCTNMVENYLKNNTTIVLRGG